MAKQMIRFIALLIIASCAHTNTYGYKFTCPDDSIVRMKVTEKELRNEAKLYDKVVERCGHDKSN